MKINLRDASQVAQHDTPAVQFAVLVAAEAPRCGLSPDRYVPGQRATWDVTGDALTVTVAGDTRCLHQLAGEAVRIAPPNGYSHVTAEVTGSTLTVTLSS